MIKPRLSLLILLLSFAFYLFNSCSGGGDVVSILQEGGTWKLVSYEGEEEIQECDKALRFAFSKEEVKKRGSITTYRLTITQGEPPCNLKVLGDKKEYLTEFGAQASKTLYIKNLNTSFMNMSGSFKVQEASKDKVVLANLRETMIYTFKPA